MSEKTTQNVGEVCTAPSAAKNAAKAGDQRPVRTTFDTKYTGWGRCEKCKAKVPPAGARIGFFGKQDVCPRWCRDCVVKSGDTELLEIWDTRVTEEADRRASRKAKKKEDKALMGAEVITKRGP